MTEKRPLPYGVKHNRSSTSTGLTVLLSGDVDTVDTQRALPKSRLVAIALDDQCNLTFFVSLAKRSHRMTDVALLGTLGFILLDPLVYRVTAPGTHGPWFGRAATLYNGGRPPKRFPVRQARFLMQSQFLYISHPQVVRDDPYNHHRLCQRASWLHIRFLRGRTG